MSLPRTNDEAGHGLEVGELLPEDLDACWDIWRRGLDEEARHCPWIPRAWSDDPARFREYLSKHLQASVAARLRGATVGYMAYDVFLFHGEECAFSPVMAHGASPDLRASAYELMYTELSRRWIGKGCLTHLVTFWAHDLPVRESLYRLGFGLYVVDAFRSTEPLDARDPPGLTLRRAGPSDAHGLEVLVEESRVYYARAPLFLVRPPRDFGYARALLEDESLAVFLACLGEAPVGFMNVRMEREPEAHTLCRSGTAMLDPLGAFVRSRCRGAGVGAALLARCLQWSRSRGAAELHVDYESANLSGSRFWPRFFTPALASVKRTVFADARGERRKITVRDHDPAWAEQFATEAELLRGALGGCVEAIHHIGSTAVPGLAAKPTLDILIEVSDLDAVERTTVSVEQLGYRAMGEHGIPGRRYFQKGFPDHTRHVHLYRSGDPNVARHLVFRDYLRCHPGRAREYGELKRRLASQDPYDVDGYLRGKHELAERLEREALEWRGLLAPEDRGED